MNKRGWSTLDHPADMMIEVWGETFEAFCQNAVRALNHFLGVSLSEQTEQCEIIEIEGSCPEERIVNLLREALFHFAARSLLVTKLGIIGLVDNGMQVEACFKPAALGPDSIEIKGITYHGLTVHRTDQGWHARLVFDV